MKSAGIILLVSICSLSIAQDGGVEYLKPYRIVNGDSLLTEEFVKQLCLSLREKSESMPGYPSYFEQLLNLAAGAHYRFQTQRARVLDWWKTFTNQCVCQRQGNKFPEGGLLKQLVHADFRDLANIIGPNGRLTLDLEMPDPVDGLDILSYVKKTRSEREARFDNNRKRFQNDETWKTMSFFLMLFTEYDVQREVNSQLDN